MAFTILDLKTIIKPLGLRSNKKGKLWHYEKKKHYNHNDERLYSQKFADFNEKKVWHEYRLVYDKTASFKSHLQKLLTYYIKYKREFLLIHKHGLTNLILDELNDFFKPISEDKSLSVEDCYRIYWYAGAIYNTVLLWFSTEMKESPEKLSEMHDAFIPNTSDREFLTTHLYLSNKYYKFQVPWTANWGWQNVA